MCRCGAGRGRCCGAGLRDMNGRNFLFERRSLVLLLSGTKMGFCSFGMEIFDDLVSLFSLVLGRFGNMIGAKMVMEVGVKVVVEVATEVF